MKALMLTAYNQLEYQDVPEPEIGPTEVLIAVRACGICGSDVHGLDGSTGRRQPPLIMGHEAAGVIAAVGARVRPWAVGQRVTFDSTVYCGECPFCRAGRINLCEDRRVLGVSCGQYRQHGAFAQYVAVPQRILYRLSESVSFEQAAMVEPLSIAYHAIHRARIALGDSALVVGAGMIGLLVVQLLRAAGCGRIIAVDVDDNRLARARWLGADEALRADQGDARNAIRDLTQGRGADLAVEAVGIPSTVRLAVEMTRKGGQVVLVGNITPEVEMPLQSIVTREITLFGSCSSAGQYPACLDLIARKAVDVDCLHSGTAPLAEGAAWFARLYRREPGLMKVVLVP